MTLTNYVGINIVLSLATNMTCLPLSAETNFQKTEEEAVAEVTTDDFSIIKDPAMGAVACLEIISMQLVHTGDLQSLCALSAVAEPLWNQSWSQQNGVWVISQQQVASKNSSSNHVWEHVEPFSLCAGHGHSPSHHLDQKVKEQWMGN